MSTAVKINRAPLAILERAHFALPEGRVSIGWLQRPWQLYAFHLLFGFCYGFCGLVPSTTIVMLCS